MRETDDEFLEREARLALETSKPGRGSAFGALFFFVTVALFVAVQFVRCAEQGERDDAANLEAQKLLPPAGAQGSLHGAMTPLMLCIRQGAIGGNACFTPKQAAEDPSHVEVKDAKVIDGTGYCRFAVLRGSDKGLVGDAPCSQFTSGQQF